MNDSGALPIDYRAESLEAQAEAVRLAMQGDEAAWEWMLTVHREPVFRLAYLLVGDADDAEDVTQETFLRAYRYLARFDPQRPMRAWLLKIAANLARNRGRSLGRYLAALKRAFLAEAQEPIPRVDALGERNLENRLLWQAIRRLRPEDQEIIYMRYFLDLPVDETADALGVAPGTVKSRLHRALERLREMIRRELPEMETEMHG